MLSVLVAVWATGLFGGWSPQPGGAVPSVVGTWLGEARTEGGLGNWIDFREDGTCLYGFGAILDGTYRFDGSSLRTRVTGTERELPPIALHVEGDTALQQQAPPADAPPRERLSQEERAMFDRMSKPITMTRVGTATPGDPPLVGTWTYTHPTGATAFETYTRDGQMYLLVLFAHGTVEGSYTVDSASVRMKLPDGYETLTRKGDLLMSGTLEGRHATFRRAPQ